MIRRHLSQPPARRDVRNLAGSVNLLWRPTEDGTASGRVALDGSAADGTEAHRWGTAMSFRRERSMINCESGMARLWRPIGIEPGRPRPVIGASAMAYVSVLTRSKRETHPVA